MVVAAHSVLPIHASPGGSRDRAEWRDAVSGTGKRDREAIEAMLADPTWQPSRLLVMELIADYEAAKKVLAAAEKLVDLFETSDVSTWRPSLRLINAVARLRAQLSRSAAQAPDRKDK